jgi:hypothetical protein
MITVITMYRGSDAEMFTQVVQGRLTPEMRKEWRQRHQCDLPLDHPDADDTDASNMFFREFEQPLVSGAFGMYSVYNVDGGEDDEPIKNLV